MHKRKGKIWVLATFSNTYYRKGKWYYTLLTRTQLIKKLALYQSNDKHFFERLCSEMIDIPLAFDHDMMLNYNDYTTYYFIGRMVNNEAVRLTQRSLARALKEADKLNSENKVVHRRSRYYRVPTKYEFRCDPVSFTGKRRWHRGSYYRRCPSKKLLVEVYGEYTEYTRSRRKSPKNLPVWDDRPRHTDKSWKTSYKCKRQWMKNKKL